MKLTSPDAWARAVYAILLVVSLPIPMFHHRALGEALWAIRYPWGLHPAPILILWQLGRLSGVLPAAVLSLLLASWRWNVLCAPRALVSAALVVCTFTVLYAMVCTSALRMALSMP